MNKRSGPLEGIKVVELGTHMAVPNCARAMGDCGADVIKVEGIKGEEWRVLGRTYGMPISDEENALFTAQNSNKKFIALDLKAPEGLEAMKKLIAGADVFVTNVRLKSLKKMGLDYDSLKDANPRLVFAHFTGFGYVGPDCERPGFDMAAFWARSGAMADWSDKDSFPLKPTSGFGDAASSNTMLSGIMMSLFAREKSGKGGMISTSLYGNGVWFNSSGVVITQEPYNNVYPKSGLETLNPIAHIYRCKDGEWIIITVVDYNARFKQMLTLLELEEYIDDPRFADIKAVQKDPRPIVAIFNAAFMKKDRAEWVAIFDKADIVYERLTHMRDISTDPQAIENNYVETVKFKSGTEIKMSKYPLLFSDYDLKDITASAGIGCDSEEILSSIGYTKEQIKAMEDKQAIRSTKR